MSVFLSNITSLFNLSRRFRIIDVIPRADRVISTANIISRPVGLDIGSENKYPPPVGGS